MLGKVFSFVASDVESKITILQNYRSDPDIGENYVSIQTLIKYEEANNRLRDSKRPSGARTVLRLHRALNFFSLYMKELSVLDADSSSASIAKDCYKKTLANYHPWYLQKTVSLAMYTLPNKAQLIEKAFAAEEQEGGQMSENACKEASDKMLELAKASELTYNIVEKLYNDKGLLDLPWYSNCSSLFQRKI